MRKTKIIATQHIVDKHWPKYTTGAHVDYQQVVQCSMEDVLQTAMNKCQIEMIEHYWPNMDAVTRTRATETINRLRLRLA